jgi:CRP-like cAMP-binding protein
MAGHSAPPIIQNRLLTALPADVLARMLPDLHPVVLNVRRSLITPNRPIEAVYFIESGWVSLVSVLQDGAAAEVGLIGREGMVGVPLVLGTEEGFEEAFVQAKGSALRMQADIFQRTLEQTPSLQRLLLRYCEAIRCQATQLAACNGRHQLEQRFARWLLVAHDRTDGDDLPVTQEFMSMMLCVNRPSITVVAGIFQRAGMIRYRRGRISVVDRSALEAASCECYGAITRRFDHLLVRNLADM